MTTIDELEAKISALKEATERKEKQLATDKRNAAIERTAQLLSERMSLGKARSLCALWQQENRLTVSDTGSVTVTLQGNIQTSPDNPKDFWTWARMDNEVKEFLPPPTPRLPRATVAERLQQPKPTTYTPQFQPGTMQGSIERSQAIAKGLVITEPDRWNQNTSLSGAIGKSQAIFDKLTKGR
jgi:hypothetical protein